MKITVTTDKNRIIQTISFNAAIEGIKRIVAFILRWLGYSCITAYILSLISSFFWKTAWFKGLMNEKVLDVIQNIFAVGSMIYMAWLMYWIFRWAHKEKTKGDYSMTTSKSQI